MLRFHKVQNQVLLSCLKYELIICMLYSLSYSVTILFFFFSLLMHLGENFFPYGSGYVFIVDILKVAILVLAISMIAAIRLLTTMSDLK